MHALHHAPRVALLAAALCAACNGALMAAPDPQAGASAAAPESNELTLSHGKKLSVPKAGLTLQLMRVQDSRCPKGVACIWAGHAAVTLKVMAPGQPAATIVIGTAAPASMNLPFEATAVSHRFTLVALEPQNSQDGPVPVKQYRARVRVSPL
jgi:hypothetical protein